MTKKRNLAQEIIEGLKELKSGGGEHVTLDEKDYLLAINRLKEKNPRISLDEIERRLNTKLPDKKTSADSIDELFDNIKD